MRDSSCERVMRAALEQIATHRFDGSCHAIDPRDCFDVYEEVARTALAAVAEMPAADTEAWEPVVRAQAERLEAAEARLAQIAELLEWVEHEYPASLYPSTRKALRLARGEAAS